MTTTLCTSGSVKLKAGVDHTALTFAQYEELINQAEGADKQEKMDEILRV